MCVFFYEKQESFIIIIIISLVSMKLKRVVYRVH